MTEASTDPLLEPAERGMLLAWRAHQQPDVPAIIGPSGSLTFAELNARSNRLARALRRRGLQTNDAVALISGNRTEFSEVSFACQRSGLRLTPVNWHQTGEEAGYVVDDCEARVVIADARNEEVATRAASMAPRARVRIAIGGEIGDFEPYEQVIEPEDDADIDDPVLGSTMLYTSGTTGRPKGVHRTVTARQAAMLSRLFDYVAGQDVHLCTGPLYHAAPLAFSHLVPLVSGAGVVIMELWDPEEALRLIETHRITHTHMVPTMFVQLLKLPAGVRSRYDVSSLRNVLHGAAPCPVHVKHAIIEWLGPIVFEYYAATEGTGTMVDSATWLSRPGTVGKVVDGQVKIADEQGNEYPPNEIGTVLLKAPDTGRFEYFKDKEKTEAAYRGDYYTLGDIGYLDEEGFLFLTDRSTDLIISGGVNIYPTEIDAVLIAHPKVADSATIGVPNDEWGEDVKSVVELVAGVERSRRLEAELIQFARDRLAHFKCPRTIDFVDALPRQQNGKIYRRLLRDRYRAEAETDRGPL